MFARLVVCLAAVATAHSDGDANCTSPGGSGWAEDAPLLRLLRELDLTTCEAAIIKIDGREVDGQRMQQLRDVGQPVLMHGLVGGTLGPIAGSSARPGRRQRRRHRRRTVAEEHVAWHTDKASFLRAFGRDNVTLQDSFVFSHFGKGMGLPAGRIHEFAWQPQVSIAEWVAGWRPYDADSAWPPGMVFHWYEQAESVGRLLAGLSLPRWLERLAADRRPEGAVFRNDWLLSGGASGSGITFHAHHESFILQLAGSKLWFLYPPGRYPAEPSYSALMLSPTTHWFRTLASLPAEARPTVCLQRSGELLWLPDSWLHATLNVGESLAVGAQTRLVKVDSERTFRSLVERNEGCYFAALQSMVNADPNDGPGAVRKVRAALGVSPLHMNVRLAAFEHAAVLGQDASLALLQDAKQAMEAQVAAGQVQPAHAAHCLAALGWKCAAGLFEAASAEGASGLERFASAGMPVLMQAAQRALEWDPGEQLARVSVALLGASRAGDSGSPRKRK